MPLVSPQYIHPTFFPNSDFKGDFLRFVTCGSVDAGKSTLMGRLLYDSRLLYEDQINTLKTDTEKYSVLKEKEHIDFSLLLDGLQDEREQGITIDLAYRFFQIGSRRFIVADAPGHEQYTKNMAAGASNSSLGIIVIDATKGILPQTRKHTQILYMMGVRHFFLCVNKMDLIHFSEGNFKEISKTYEKLLHSFDQEKHKISLYSLPVSAYQGYNITVKSEIMEWYAGPSLLDLLQNVEINEPEEENFIFPVQLVSRQEDNKRFYMGNVLSGIVKKGDTLKILPSGKKNTVKEIIEYNDKNIEKAQKGRSISLVLEDETDIGRGDLIIHEKSHIKIADHFHVNLLCIEQEPLYSSRSYLFKFSHRVVSGILSDIKGEENRTSSHAPHSLHMNEFGSCHIHLSQKIPFMLYEANKTLGSFLVIDRLSKKTVGIGMILFDLHRSHTLLSQDSKISKSLRAHIKGQKPHVLWFTGLSGAGKTTLANLVEEKLFKRGYHTYLIDGDSMRRELNADLGFKNQDRIENIRRLGYLSKYFMEAGIIPLVAAISPFRVEREHIRTLFDPSEFIEIYVKTSLKECMKRDPKKIYEKYQHGEVSHLTGIESVYEPPLHPEITLETEEASPETLSDKVVDYFLNTQRLG